MSQKTYKDLSFLEKLMVHDLISNSYPLIISKQIQNSLESDFFQKVIEQKIKNKDTSKKEKEELKVVVTEIKNKRKQANKKIQPFVNRILKHKSKAVKIMSGGGNGVDPTKTLSETDKTDILNKKFNPEEVQRIARIENLKAQLEMVNRRVETLKAARKITKKPELGKMLQQRITEIQTNEITPLSRRISGDLPLHDKAISEFQKQSNKKKGLFSGFSLNKFTFGLFGKEQTPNM